MVIVPSLSSARAVHSATALCERTATNRHACDIEAAVSMRNDVENVFLAGHRIRLEVSSSTSQRSAGHSNTGGDIATEPPTQYRPAINCILHDPAHPSHLILPIIET